LFALVAYARLESVELALQSSIKALIVRALSDEDEHQNYDDDDEDSTAHTDDDRPPASHSRASVRSPRVDVLQVTEIKEQIADSHLHIIASARTNIDTINSSSESTSIHMQRL